MAHYPYQGAPEDPYERRSKILRSTLIFAAVAGVVTVVVGLLFMVASPGEYGLDDGRESLSLANQPNGQVPANPETEKVRFEAPPEEPPPLPPVVPAPPMQPSTPMSLSIKRLGIKAPIKPLGVDRQNRIETPPIENRNLVGWYRHSSTAGEVGPSVLVGHKDTRTTSAVFSRVGEIVYGDKIEVQRRDGTTAVFTVAGVEQISKTTFPTDRVYGDRDTAQLHVITCGGVYNRNTGHYTDNIIVYATLTSSHRS